MGASTVMVPAAGSAAMAWAGCVSAVGGATAEGRAATSAWRRTTRTRMPPASTSSSARSWATASSTISAGVHRRGARIPAMVPRSLAMPLAGRGHAAQVLGAARVHLHDVALVEEERNLDGGARLELSRLRPARGRVAADTRIGLDDGELHEVGELDGHGAAVDEQDVDLRVLLEEVARVTHLVRRQRDLIVRLRVHEVVTLVLVQILHVLLVEVDELHLLARAERVVDDPPLPHVLELGAHEGAALARLDVLEVDDGVGLPVVLDLETLLEFGRGHLHALNLSVSGSWPGAPRPGAPGPGHRPGSSSRGEGRSAPPRRGGLARGRGRRNSSSRTCRPRGRGRGASPRRRDRPPGGPPR